MAKMVVIAPDGTKTEVPCRDQGPLLEQLHDAVGGYIELYHVNYEGKVRRAYVCEDGKRKRMAPNQHATALLVNQSLRGLPLCGNMAIEVRG